MAFTTLKFKPGINRDITSLSNENGYVDGDKIRFRNGYPEKLGGWSKYSSNTYQGSARRLHNWVALDGSDFLGIGSHLKYYIEEGQQFNDITPIRSTTSAGEVTFSATTDSNIVTVTDAGHSAIANDFVTFSGASSLGGNVTAAILNAEHQITRFVSSSQYEITLSVTANSSDTGNGSFTDATVDTTNGDATVTMDSTATLIAGGTISGTGIPSGTTIASITDGTTFEMSANASASNSNITATINVSSAVYQINTGLDNTVGGTGFGAGQYGGTTSGAVSTTINEGGTFSNSDTTLTVASSNPGHQIVANDFILIEEEILKVTNVSTNDLTVTRAQEGTAAATHADGTTVFLIVGNAATSDDFVGWGDPASVTVAGAQIRTWSHDNFGEDLLINPRDSGIFYWDKTDGTSARAVELSSTTLFSGEKSVPTIAKQVLVSDIDRHVIAFGCDAINASSSAAQGNGIQDPLLIRFSSQENPVDWFPTTTNTAGDLRLGAGSTFVQAVETKREILIYTDKSLHSMQFIGPPFTFGISQLASNITIMSPASAIATEDVVYWMGIDNFYTHAGQTQQLPCTVKDKVFLDFNLEERDKVVAGINSEFGEVWWFYPSADSSENNRYVIWNYVEQVWYYGTLTRTAWIDRGVRTFPIAVGSPNLFNHESGFDDDTSAMSSFVESSVMDIGDGDKFLSIRRVIPDLTFTGSVTGSSPNATFTVKARDFPGSDFLQTGDATTSRTATSPVEQYTEKLDYRIRGRSFAIKLASTALGCKFKMGTPRIDIREDGKR
tara:strand:- start:56 stop:2404 length:2349 start_codon:yes stop_codon:yes gene_type:complete